MPASSAAAAKPASGEMQGLVLISRISGAPSSVDPEIHPRKAGQAEQFPHLLAGGFAVSPPVRVRRARRRRRAPSRASRWNPLPIWRHSRRCGACPSAIARSASPPSAGRAARSQHGDIEFPALDIVFGEPVAAEARSAIGRARQDIAAPSTTQPSSSPSEASSSADLTIHCAAIQPGPVRRHAQSGVASPASRSICLVSGLSLVTAIALALTPVKRMPRSRQHLRRQRRQAALAVHAFDQIEDDVGRVPARAAPSASPGGTAALLHGMAARRQRLGHRFGRDQRVLILGRRVRGDVGMQDQNFHARLRMARQKGIQEFSDQLLIGDLLEIGDEAQDPNSPAGCRPAD